MDLSRRGFVKSGMLTAGAALAGAAGGMAATRKVALTVQGEELVPVLTPGGQLVHVMRDHLMTGRPPSDPVVRRGIPGRKWVMVIDLASCDGCGACTQACSKMHFIPPDREWIPVMKMQDAPETAPYFFPKPCFQCDSPPCTKVCPVDATFKRQDGIVLIDNERCIGCRFCMAACPYSTRHFNWGRPDEPSEAQERGDWEAAERLADEPGNAVRSGIHRAAAAVKSLGWPSRLCIDVEVTRRPSRPHYCRAGCKSDRSTGSRETPPRDPRRCLRFLGHASQAFVGGDPPRGVSERLPVITNEHVQATSVAWGRGRSLRISQKTKPGL